MDPLALFFALNIDPGMLLLGSYQPWLVALSLGIAIFASTMGLHAASQARDMHTPHLRRVTLLAASLSLGCGVWAMHFIGMLAFKLCAHVEYDAAVTTASLLPSVGASWVAMQLLAQDRVSPRQLLTSGVLVGAGIGAMHYAGMAAMRMSAQLRYDPGMFALSIVVAVVLAILALWIRFGMATLTRVQSPIVLNVVAGTVMGVAIAGMHYTGMAAARFVGVAERLPAITDPVPLALSISLVTVVATVLVAAATGLAQYRQMVEQLQSKENKLRAISDTALDGIIVFDHHGTIMKVNPGVERIYGRKAPDMVGQPITLLMIEPYQSQAKAHMQGFLDRVDTVLGHEMLSEALHRDGSHIPIRLVLGKAMVDGHPIYVAYVTDIRERMKMEAALRESEAQFRTLIGNIPGIAYRCKLEKGWPMVFISDAVERITGFPAGDFLGMMPSLSFADLVPKDDVAVIARVVGEAVHANRPFVLEFRLRHRDGSMRWMWGNGSIVRGEDDQVQWIDGVLLDITERREMEEALRVAKEKAEAAAVARSSFLANMSHEIRTPMNAIIGFTEVVLGSGLPETQRKHLETVRRSARSLLHLLNDILDSSKLERGAVELEELDFNLREVLSQLLAEQSIQAHRKGLSLTQDIDAGVEPFVRGDPHRLRQILVNLVGNAVKFTERGGVHLSVTREGEQLHFRVRDSGIGIPADRLDTIFDAFTQADASMSRRFGGTGLGTTISKQLTELMKGRIWVASTLGEGSTFHVLLPLAAGEEARATTSVSHRDIGKLPALQVLAVDDVAQNTELLSVMLGRLGHQIREASNGEEAVAAFRQQRPDIVLMDVQMPVMDGLQASRAIRAIEASMGWPRTPIIALSASVLPEDRTAAIEAGMDGFAVKPVELPQLMAEVARVCHLAPAAPPSTAASTSDPTPADTPAPTEAPLPLDPQLVDQVRALARWGQVDAYAAALRRFAREQQAWLAKADGHMAPANLAAGAAEAHRIKGAAGNLGLSLLGSACERAERVARQADDAQWPAAWSEVRTALQATVDALAALSAPGVPDTLANAGTQPPAHTDTVSAPTAHALAPDAAQTLVDQLRHAFRRGEPLEAELQRLLDGVTAWTTAAEREAVHNAVEDFDFDAALAALDQLAARLPTLEMDDAAR
jgi:PAS domain S-box-containing protein